jgi:hypothetical protein
LDSAADSSGSSAAQSPVGSTQNVFSRLFNSLAQLIGARQAQAAQPAASAQSPQAVQMSIGSKINTTA